MKYALRAYPDTKLPVGWPEIFEIEITAETDDELLDWFASAQPFYNFRPVENILLLQRRVCQLEAQLEQLKGKQPVTAA